MFLRSNRKPKPHTGEDLIVFGDVSDADLMQVREVIGRYEDIGSRTPYRKLYWLHDANPRVARFTVDQMVEFMELFDERCDEVGYPASSMRSFDEALLGEFMGKAFEEVFGYQPSRYFLVFSSEALESIPEPYRQTQFTFLRLLRHLSEAPMGYYNGAVVVTGNGPKVTTDREDYIIRGLVTATSLSSS